jgi:natural product biosynthesis luciferase-like monooxygenase protein
MCAENARPTATRCAFVGDEPLVAQCVQLAIDHGLDVVLVASTNDAVLTDAALRRVPTADPTDLADALDQHPADVLFSIANLRIVADDVLDRVATAINFHDGPLPGYAGLNVTTWALLAGEREHAVTWHLMTSHVDGGDVVDVEPFRIDPEDTAFSLNARAYEAALTSFPRVAAAVAAGSLAPHPQPAGRRRVFRRDDRPAALFDPTRPAAETLRTVRALDFGHRIANPIGSVRVVVGDAVVVIEQAVLDEHRSSAEPGTVLSSDAGALVVATADGDLVFSTVATPEGVVLDKEAARAHLGIADGSRVREPRRALVEVLPDMERHLARVERRWLDHLAHCGPTDPPFTGSRGGTAATAAVDVEGLAPAACLAAVGAWLGAVSGAPTVGVGVVLPGMGAIIDATAPLTVPPVLAIDVANRTFAELSADLADELAAIAGKAPLLLDAVGRDPRTRGRPLETSVVVEFEGDPESASRSIANGVALHIAVDDARITVAVADDSDRAERTAEQLAVIIEAARRQPATPVDALPIVGSAELAVLDALNDTERSVDPATIDALVRKQMAGKPDDPALSFGGRTMTYRQLDDAVAAMGQRLAAAGLERGQRVGIAVPRGIEMVTSVLATLEVGAAYVPLDPTYPVERLRQMIADSGIKALVTSDGALASLAGPACRVLDPTNGSELPDERRIARHDPSDLAYVIYTSGSTGVPKGVMLEHRQVVNFFAAMDEVIGADPPGVWLAVTSLSFDISVLELLWTLSRGFHVVVAPDRHLAEAFSASTPRRPVTFSLFYFAAGEESAADGYRLLLESARFADRHGFEAVWTPERHFHAFGGAYPNPSVTGAALAAITSSVAIRAGSVVLPLHSPIRVAEEWAVVDNLSGGRVGISFAAGWQPDDFVLNPGAYATAKQDLPERIDTVRRLWRGETVALPGHDGEPVEVATLPRPVQAELPTWLTSAGSPSTFERAGALGVNLLTHLLGQSIEQLAANIERYRDSWRAAGHAGDGQVTLMLHTYLAVDAAAARETAREPMKDYLRTAVGLLRDVASAFPTFAGRVSGSDDLFASLTAQELDELLEVAADRYIGSSGLFGTPEDAAAVVETLAAVGVDEVACLIDFGIDTDAVLASLDLLAQAKHLVAERRHAVPDTDGGSVAVLAERHQVTHVQCTPSLAAMMLADPADRAALTRLRHLLVGGEALPAALAAELRDVLSGRLTNMYGPTETTIWSLVHEIDGAPEGSIPIGTPIANTSVFVLDARGRRLPLGVFGELHIGGAGVARGYHARPELTAERFTTRPGMGRVYATGDLARIDPDGSVEFGGRIDNQVKVRGHRIELGEIEAVIDRHPDVKQSIVVARGTAADVQLVAFVVPADGARLSAAAIRKHVASTLPDVMVPALVQSREALPLTPNRKVDRKALANEVAIDDVDGDRVVVAPADDVERLVAEIWAAELDREVGRDDNFFDIGGHSLVAVKVYRRLCDATMAPLALTDVFRYPTVRAMAAHLASLSDGGAPTSAVTAAVVGTDRGAMRRLALSRRGNVDDAR